MCVLFMSPTLHTALLLVISSLWPLTRGTTKIVGAYITATDYHFNLVQHGLLHKLHTQVTYGFVSMTSIQLLDKHAKIGKNV